jgi:23S rRNA (pseudouridine1915-N3)-methyltransferase
MKIKLLLMGKTTDESIRNIEADYEKRIKRYTAFESVVIDNSSVRNGPELIIKQKEGEMILKRVSPTDHLILLDERGKTYSSVQFANEVNNWMNSSKKTVVLTIGGAYGFSEDVKKRANGLVSLSAMTFSHQIVRVIMMEQVYRAFTILNNEPYHHA